MKNLRILSYTFIAMLFVFFTGCEKSETVPEAKLLNEYTIQEKIMQNGISAFNNIGIIDSQDGENIINRDGDGIFEEKYGIPTESRVLYERGSQEFFMMPLIKNGIVENFMMVDESDELFMMQRSKTIDMERVGNLFSISNELINDITSTNIENTLGSDYSVIRDGGVVLKIERGDLPEAETFSLEDAFFRDLYLTQSAIQFTNEFGLTSIQMFDLIDAFHACAFSSNAFMNPRVTIHDVMDTEVCFVEDVISGYNSGGYPCAYVAAACGISNWLSDDPRIQLTPDELVLISLNCACVVQMATNRLIVKTQFDAKFPGSVGYLDCGDAFRHSLFSALNASSVLCIQPWARLFGTAHESGSPTDQESIMDLNNNEDGFAIASLGIFINPIAITNEVCLELAAGSMEIFLNPADPVSPLIPSTTCICTP